MENDFQIKEINTKCDIHKEINMLVQQEQS